MKLLLSPQLSLLCLTLVGLASPSVVAALFAEKNNNEEEDYDEETTTKNTVRGLDKVVISSKALRGEGEGGATKKPSTVSHTKPKGVDTRIIGGSQASVGEFPYFVQLETSGFCGGGTLIAPDLVLTAAHCYPNGGVGNWLQETVIVGGYDVDSTTNGAVRVVVSEAVPHPNYSDVTSQWDFMLLKLETPVTNKEFATLNFNSNIPFEDQTLTVIGQGRTSNSAASGASKLQEVNVTYIPTDECNVILSDSIQPDSMFCAGTDSGGQGSCQQDDGGPIVIQQNGQDVVVGVISWGLSCIFPNFPGVYARISGAENWIKEAGCALSDTNPSFCQPDPQPEPGEVCVNAYVYFRHDTYPQDNEFSLKNTATPIGQTPIWDEWKFPYLIPFVEREACIDRNGCFKFEIIDRSGDGLGPSGLLKLEYDGEVLYEGRGFGGGFTEYLGDGC